MVRAPAGSATFGEPLVQRHPWLAALLLGTVVTPAAVILAVPAPRPLDVLLAWPLVLLDRLVGPGRNIGTVEEPLYESTPLHLVALLAGILLTWLSYVLLARLVLWRVVPEPTEGG
jgi:hypothetical protein